MPAIDRHHGTVIRCLKKANWQILKEHYSIVIGQSVDDLRRLYIDLFIQSEASQAVLIEVKSLAQSPVHQFMMLVGQYITYRTALDYIGSEIPLYIAISENDYHTIVKHPLGQQVIYQTLKAPIPFVIYDAYSEEIIEWIPQP